MTGVEAFEHLTRCILIDSMPRAQLLYLLEIVRKELRAPKATDQAKLLQENEELKNKVFTLTLLVQDQEERLNNLLPKAIKRGRPKNDN